MNRALACLALGLLVTAGCMTTTEGVVLQPLPDDGTPRPYAELRLRARLQVEAADYAFYADRWEQVEEHARGLEQTARYLEKARDLPPPSDGKSPVKPAELLKLAEELREAAKKRDTTPTNQILTRLQLLVRELPPATVAPLPDDAPPQPYADLVHRARKQAEDANAAFFRNRWEEVDAAGRGLEQTAKFLARATNVPPKHQGNYPVRAGDLGKLAQQLREAAQKKDADQTNQVLARIQLLVRELRPEE
jgi:hypothetical protein